MALNSRIMEMIRLAKKACEQSGDEEICICENCCDDLGGDAAIYPVVFSTTSTRSGEACDAADGLDERKARRTECLDVISDQIDALEDLGFVIDMEFLPRNGPVVSDHLRQLVWAMNALADFDAAFEAKGSCAGEDLRWQRIPFRSPRPL